MTPEQPKTYQEQIESWCVHFNGIDKGTCKAGVLYASVIGPKVKPGGLAIPCIRGREGGKPCEKQCWPSPEEVAKEVAEHEAHMQKVLLLGPVLKTIRQAHKGANWQGIVECPACKGKLHIRHAPNGHTHGACETQDCLRWME